jgi:hypothetical protein
VAGSQFVSDEAPSRRVGSERYDNAAAFFILGVSQSCEELSAMAIHRHNAT